MLKLQHFLAPLTIVFSVPAMGDNIVVYVANASTFKVTEEEYSVTGEDIYIDLQKTFEFPSGAYKTDGDYSCTVDIYKTGLVVGLKPISQHPKGQTFDLYGYMSTFERLETIKNLACGPVQKAHIKQTKFSRKLTLNYNEPVNLIIDRNYSLLFSLRK
ncbi:MAG: hypothetical protein V3T17_02780 [Pseudomonadales bacterium]